MRIRLAAALLLLINDAGSTGELLACGDKFLVVSRATRFRHAATPRKPAVILIYADPASNLPRALANVQVETTLRKAGYQATSVSNADEFDRALVQGTWDLILADAAEGQSIQGRMKAGEGAVLLPVFYNASSDELRQAKKLYPYILESPTKSQAFLDTIDDALASRPRPTAGVSGETTG